MINKINGLPIPITQKSDQSSPKTKEGQGDFLSTLNDFMGDVNQLQQEAGESVKSLASREVSDPFSFPGNERFRSRRSGRYRL